MEGQYKIRVIIFGIYKFECRIKMENSFHDNVELIGYMDNFYNEKTFNYRPVINIYTLKDIEYDYILINSVRTDSIEEIYKQLHYGGGVKKEKIIRWYYYSYFGNDSPIHRYQKFDKEIFDGFIFGMSHAVDGFLPHYFDKNIYRFCARGMDMFYHRSLVEYILKDNTNKRYFMFELPYYIFNYETFHNKFFKYRINYYKEIESIKNSNINDENLYFLKEYEAYEKIFKSEIGDPQTSSEIPLTNRDSVVRLDLDERIYEEFWDVNSAAISRNKIYFNEIVRMIYEYNRDSKIAVVVFPHNIMEVNKLGNKLTEVKQIFYDILNSYHNEVELFDFFYIYKERPEFFKDWTHLNNKGAKEFTQMLNIEMNGRFY